MGAMNSITRNVGQKKKVKRDLYIVESSGTKGTSLTTNSNNVTIHS